MKQKTIIDDGFRADLVETALFAGTLEIPSIDKPAEIIIPQGMIPFTARARSKTYNEFIVFYEHDIRFADILTNTDKYIDNIKKFPGILSPDCSVYRDMPLCLQIANTYMNRAIGHYLQKQGVYVIPNVRWGDERSYTTKYLPEKFAFLGLPKHSIVSIGTYGAIQGQENKHYFYDGLGSMLDELEPEIVLVYGRMPASVFDDYKDKTKFINYSDWTTFQKRKVI